MQDPPILDSCIVSDPNIESIILKIWDICFTQGGRKVLGLPHLYSWGYISVFLKEIRVRGLEGAQQIGYQLGTGED